MRVLSWLVVPLGALYGALCGWAMTTGHPVIGITGAALLLVGPNVFRLLNHRRGVRSRERKA